MALVPLRRLSEATGLLRTERETEELSAAELAILDRLRQHCPPGFEALVDEPCEDWSLTLAEHGSEGGDWLLADNAAASRLSWRREGLQAEVVETAEGVQRELALYFQEFSRRRFVSRAQLLRPTARAVLARKLWRYAATSLRNGNLSELEAWCAFLKGVVRSRVFDRSNWFHRSRFEQTINACLARLDKLQRLRQGVQEEQRPCNFAPRQIDEARSLREQFGVFRTPDLKHFKDYRQMASVERVLSRVEVLLPSLPGLRNIALVHRLLTGLVLGRACMGLGGHLMGEAKAVASGDIDERTLAEDAAVSMASAAAFAVVRCASVAIGITNPVAALAVDTVAPNVAAHLTGFLIRFAGQRMCGSHRVRALRCAYLSLGLNPLGAGIYRASDIEAQLDWKLREQDQDPLQLWAAYSLIRMHQHQALRDPFMSTAGSSNVEDADYAMADPLQRSQ